MDVERIEQSDTWTLAPAELRPWLLMLWMTAWKQTPCGSLTDDDTLIAARIGMPQKLFAKHRAILMRGWWRADDGRLYHAALSERVEAMLVKREKDAGRTAARRAKTVGLTPTPPEVAEASRVTTPGLTGEFDTKHQAPSTKHQVLNTAISDEIACARPEAVAPPGPEQSDCVEPLSAPPYSPPDCPHQAVLALWAEVLPELPQHLPSQWKDARADHLRARWRENAVRLRWGSSEDGLAFMRRMFEHIRESRFLMGQTQSRVDGRKPFVAKLEWVVKSANWSKVVEGDYHS